MADKDRIPEQQARDTIDAMLEQAGWQVQSKIDFGVQLPSAGDDAVQTADAGRL